jgi:hypothetical protein
VENDGSQKWSQDAVDENEDNMYEEMQTLPI